MFNGQEEISMKNISSKILILVLLFSLVSCLQKDEKAANSSVEENLTPPGITPHQLEQYDIEEVASIYQEFAMPVNYVSLLPNTSPDKSKEGILPRPDHKKREEIRNLLKGLLDGPCPKNADEIFDRFIEMVQKRIDHLSELLLKATDPSMIEKIKHRIEVLEELEKKLIEKKEDCANGTANCSDEFQAKIELQITKLDKSIEELEQKILTEQNELFKEHLEKLLERALELKARLQELLAKC